MSEFILEPTPESTQVDEDDRPDVSLIERQQLQELHDRRMASIPPEEDV